MERNRCGLEMFSVIELNQISVANQSSIQKKFGKINSGKIFQEIYQGKKLF